MTFTPPTRPTWVPDAAGSLWDVDNLSLGVFSDTPEGPRRVGARIGDFVLDLAPPSEINPRGEVMAAAFRSHSLNAYMAQGPSAWEAVQTRLAEILTDPGYTSRLMPHLYPLNEVTLHLPVEVGDYVDFYASEHHAANVGRILRPDSEPLLPNWKHLPVGYHGRGGTVVASGTPIVRPRGQRRPAGSQAPTFGPSQRLDIEAELGFVVGAPSAMGTPVTTADLSRHAFGVVGLNDWSARDIQAWEYVPLGPFLGKSFATSISQWVTPLASLAAAWTTTPDQEPLLDYLRVDGDAGLAIEVTVELNGEVVARPPYDTMHWGPAQMLAHMTVNGASVRTGDLWASGTISGPERGQRGSFLELSWGGSEPFAVAGAERTFLEDGDEVVLRYTAPGILGGRIGLGEVRGTILPAIA